MLDPNFDEDVVNLGYLKRILGLSDETTVNIYINKNYASRPNPPYNKGDTWIDGDTVYTCINSRSIGLYNDDDWVTESGATEKAENKNKTYLTQPSNYSPGDTWILQTDSDHKAGKKGEILISNYGRSTYNENDWVNMLSYGNVISINETLNKIFKYLINHVMTKNSGVQKIYFKKTDPPSVSSLGTMQTNDFWYNIESQKLYRLILSNSLWKSWQEITSDELLKLIKEVSQSNIVDDEEIQIFYDNPETITTMARGDICKYNNTKYRYNGTNWVELYETDLKEVIFGDDIVERTAKIETDLGQIDLSVREKVGIDEIIAKINLAIQNGQGIIHIQGNQVTIDSDHFTLDEDGHIEATSGVIGGFELGATRFKGNLNGIYNYNNYDLIAVMSYVMNLINQDFNVFDIYDINNSGTITSSDYVTIKNIIQQGRENTKNITGSLYINSKDPKNNLAIYKDGRLKVSLGVGGVNTILVTCNNFICGDETGGRLCLYKWT